MVGLTIFTINMVESDGGDMKILRITVDGAPLFKKRLEMDFYAKKRVSDRDKQEMFQLSTNIYIQQAIAFAGINASGKTSTLKMISFVMEMLKCTPINKIESREILGRSSLVTINSYFSVEENNGYDHVYRLETMISSYNDEFGRIAYKIEHETLWKKTLKNSSKKNLTNFAMDKPISNRDGFKQYLIDDISFIHFYNRAWKNQLRLIDLRVLTNYNLPMRINPPMELVRYLDPSVKDLHYELINDSYRIHLTLESEPEVILYDYDDLYKYLSSGTVKGINVFMAAFAVLKKGGYLIVDELENHFNKSIVQNFIRLFLNPAINKKGAALIFSSHYIELLDIFERCDFIYINRHQNGGLTVENLSTILTRNDIKKSEAYQSNLLNGTAPEYEDYHEWLKRLRKMIDEDN